MQSHQCKRITYPLGAGVALCAAATLVCAAPESAGMSDQSVTGGATKGSFKLPGSDTSITLGGYVKLDAIFSDVSAGVNSTADQEYEAGGVPVGPSAAANERSQVKLHARQSRFFFKTSTPGALGEIATHLEFDLFGTAGNESVSNSHGLRLRHAYGSIGPLLAGQTWTTWYDVAAYPETVDFGGPAGVVFARQAQIRWTQPFAGGQWAVALENPETVLTLPDGSTLRADDDRFPDITGTLRLGSTGARYSVGALARQLRIDTPAVQDRKWVSALGVSAVLPVGQDDFRVSAYGGNGIGRYSVGFFTDGLLTADNRIEAPNAWLLMGAYRHFWAPGLRSTFALSGLRANLPEAAAASANRSAQSLHANLIWTPQAKVDLGIEYIRGRREIASGDSGTLNRLQASAQYTF